MKNILALTVALAMVGSAWAGPARFVCGETGKELKKCCCTKKDGKFVCKLTGKTLDKCCCTGKTR